MKVFFSICCGFLLSLLFRYLLHLFPDASQEETICLANLSETHKRKLQRGYLSLTSHLQDSYRFYFSLEISLSGLLIATTMGWISTIHCYLLLFSLLLSLFDWRSQEYPFLLWLLHFGSLLLFYPLNHLSLFFLLVGLVAHFYPFSIGSGDFLYLASLGLVLKLISLIWLVQLACLAGILACLLLGVKRIPFIPYLTFGLLCIIFLESYLIY